MAVDPNRQTLIQQLGEMRNARMQQMRIGGQQNQMTSRQVAMTANINNTLQQHTRQLNTLNTTMSSGFRNMSSSFASSMRGLTSAVSRGAVGAASAAGGAAMGVGRVSASAVSGVASGIASGLSTVLPAAIAGVIGKSLIWDNIDDSTKKEMGENIGGIFKNVFGDSLKPVTKELKVMTMTLADTLESLSDRISGVVSGLKGKIPQSAKDKVGGAVNSAKETAGSVAGKVKQGVSAASKMGPYIQQQAESRFETTSTVANVVAEGVDKIPAPTKDIVIIGGAAATVVGGAKLLDKLRKDAKSYKLAKPNSPRSIMTAHLHNRVLPAMKGDSKAKYMKAFSLGAVAGKVVPIASIIITLIGIEQAKNEINWLINNSDGQLTKEDGDAFIAEATQEELWGLAGGIVGGILGGLIGAGWLSAATAALGSYFGNAFSKWLHAMVSKGSTKLDRDTSSINVSVTSDVNKHAEKIGVTVDGKPYLTPAGAMKAAANESKPNAAAVSKPPSSLADALAAQESGGAGYDAVYGSSTLKSVEEYQKKTGGKKVSQMTIEEAIAFGKSRGKNKGALGRYQFMPSTLSDELLKEAGLAKDDPFNAANQDKLFAVYTKRNADALKKLGIAPTAANLQLAHVAGPKGAAKLLGAEEGKKAGDVLGYKEESAVRKTNPWMNKSASEAVALLTRKASSIQPIEAEGDAGISGPAGSEDVAIAMPTDQVSAAQKPTAGMTTKQKMDYYRDQLDGDSAKPAQGKGEGSQKPAGPFSGFASLIGGGSFESMKNELLAGLDSDMGRKAEATQAAPTIINNNGGDTNVTSGGGGGGSAPVYNPIAPAASYQSQFTSIAGIQRTA